MVEALTWPDLLDDPGVTRALLRRLTDSPRGPLHSLILGFLAYYIFYVFFGHPIDNIMVLTGVVFHASLLPTNKHAYKP